MSFGTRRRRLCWRLLLGPEQGSAVAYSLAAFLELMNGKTMQSTVLLETPTLSTQRLVLQPLGPVHVESAWQSLFDGEAMRLTGTHATFSKEQVLRHLEQVAQSSDRLDWAVIRQADRAYIGEVVLNDLDSSNQSMNFRIALFGEDIHGHGYGTEVTRAVVDYGLEVVRLHRIGLDVYDFNPRARRTYEKSGFIQEGVQRGTLRWDGAWHDSIMMSILATDPRPWRD
ncbi:GNAT family protein [Saxibacter everestensis]|uniref:GNAT family protein n=1 Tax=Saxibacter everestensis TaxID=2909229 RepID=A0ABY8QX27_9MICO|nr:GNAT family protein [Brevibacteriaceae bacterium ZFBP1038]